MSVECVKDAATSMKAAAGVSGVLNIAWISKILADLPDIDWWVKVSGVLSGLTLAGVQVWKTRIQDRQQRIDSAEKELHMEQMRRGMKE